MGLMVLMCALKEVIASVSSFFLRGFHPSFLASFRPRVQQSCLKQRSGILRFTCRSPSFKNIPACIVNGHTMIILSFTYSFCSFFLFFSFFLLLFLPLLLSFVSLFFSFFFVVSFSNQQRLVVVKVAFLFHQWLKIHVRSSVCHTLLCC